MDTNMDEKKVIITEIEAYCNLQRIKKYEKGDNPELEYQLKEAKAKLAIYGVNIQDLEY